MPHPPTVTLLSTDSTALCIACHLGATTFSKPEVIRIWRSSIQREPRAGVSVPALSAHIRGRQPPTAHDPPCCPLLSLPGSLS